jgi:hypothetical protein
LCFKRGSFWEDTDGDYRTGRFCGSSKLAAQRGWNDVGQEISRVCRCKFGFKTMGVVTVDLKEFGDYEPYTTWDMQREAV